MDYFGIGDNLCPMRNHELRMWCFLLSDRNWGCEQVACHGKIISEYFHAIAYFEVKLVKVVGNLFLLI